jgi:uncharacterized iron-regulated protein
MQHFVISCLYAFGLCLWALPAFAQVSPNPQPFRVFDSSELPVTLSQVVEHCQGVDVAFWGEEHNDAVGHALQAQFFQQLIAKYKTSREVALSLEMFERDTQVVIDEYLLDLITEKHFLSSSRPWDNYLKDYKPLVLLAKEHRLPVIAANAPRRYVNLVARRGPGALEELSPGAKGWLAPLPYPRASAAYARKFAALMGKESAGLGVRMHGSTLVDSQALWDATMADSLSRFLKGSKGRRRPLILHLSGNFHSEGKLGTVEQLLNYNPEAKMCVVTVVSRSTFSTFDLKMHSGLGDFVILTDSNAKRSF